MLLPGVPIMIVLLYRMGTCVRHLASGICHQPSGI